MRLPRSLRMVPALLALALAATLGACNSDQKRAEPLTDNNPPGVPAQGDPEGANSGAGGDAGGGNRAVDPGENP